MARLSELVQTVAKVEGMDPATVGLIARNVREAGLIATRGRGPSAAKMNLADATNLLIAVNATVTAWEAAQAVRNYRQLEVSKLRARLGDTLEQLIAAAPSGAVPQPFLSKPVPRLVAEGFWEGIEFTFYKPMPRATLFISAQTDPAIDLVDGGPPSDHDVFLDKVTSLTFNFNPPGDQKRQARKYFGDRRDATSIGYSTMRAVGELLREEAA
jgi:hypothetical protein